MACHDKGESSFRPDWTDGCEKDELSTEGPYVFSYILSRWGYIALAKKYPSSIGVIFCLLEVCDLLEVGDKEASYRSIFYLFNPCTNGDREK